MCLYQPGNQVKSSFDMVRQRHRCKCGASELEAAYIAQRKKLLRFLRAHGAGDDAEDLLQELWIKVSARPSDPIRDPVSYLYRAANSLMISRYRSRQRSMLRDDEWSGAIDKQDSGVETAVASRQEIAQAEARLRRLGNRVMTIFVMFRIDGNSQNDIARQLGISLSTVEKDLQLAYRAVALLRSEIDAG